MEAAGACVVLNDRGKFGEVTVNGEAEGSANGRDTADDVGAINGGGVPGIDGTMGCFRGDFGVAGSLVDGNFQGFVEEAEQPFDGDGLMVAAKGWVIGEVECAAHGFEVFFEGGAGVRGNKEADADAEKDVLHEGSCKGGGVQGVNVHEDGKPCEVAHGCEVVGASKVGLHLAGLPDVDVDDGKGGGDGPRVDKLALVAGGGVG